MGLISPRQSDTDQRWGPVPGLPCEGCGVLVAGVLWSWGFQPTLLCQPSVARWATGSLGLLLRGSSAQGDQRLDSPFLGKSISESRMLQDDPLACEFRALSCTGQKEPNLPTSSAPLDSRSSSPPAFVADLLGSPPRLRHCPVLLWGLRSSVLAP